MCSYSGNLVGLGSNEYVLLIDRGVCTFYKKIETALWGNNEYDNNVIGAIIGNTNKLKNKNNVFTMGSDDNKKSMNILSFMINKISYDALKKCVNEIEDEKDRVIEMVQILTRCKENNNGDVNVYFIKFN